VNDQAELDLYAMQLADAARREGSRRALSAVTDDEGWTSKAWDTICRFIDEGLEFSADDIRAVTGPAPSVGAMGAVIKKAADAGLIHAVGFSRSRSPSRHAGLQLRWERAG
jgi:hypothetical protein